MSTSRKPTSTLYTIMDLPETATAEEIRKKYKELAVKKHPDKGGSTEAFQELKDAYDVLCDSEKRATYDATLHQTSSTKANVRQETSARDNMSQQRSTPDQNVPPRRSGSPLFTPATAAEPEYLFHIFRNASHVYEPPVRPRIVVISFVAESPFDAILRQANVYNASKQQPAERVNIREARHENTDYLVAAAKSREVILNFMVRMLLADIVMKIALTKQLEEKSPLRETPRPSPFGRRAFGA